MSETTEVTREVAVAVEVYFENTRYPDRPVNTYITQRPGVIARNVVEAGASRVVITSVLAAKGFAKQEELLPRLPEDRLQDRLLEARRLIQHLADVDPASVKAANAWLCHDDGFPNATNG